MYFYVWNSQQTILLLWDLPLLRANLPDVLQLNEQQSKKQTHCIKVQG